MTDAGDGNHGAEGAAPEGGRPVVYCVIPRELAPQLHDLLRRHFAGSASVEVVVDRRSAERRRDDDRRREEGEPPRGDERRKVRSLTGRRIADRRAAQVAVDPLPLPRRARRHAAEIAFLERLEPTGEQLEDRDTARLVARFQTGDRDVFKVLYLRYFDRVYGYMRVALRDAHEAEDQTQQVFTQVFEFLDRYERRSQPFRAWLFATARNIAIRHLRRQRRVELHADEAEFVQEEEPVQDDWEGTTVVGWITDPDLMLFVERLPLAQRQVLALKFMLGMETEEIARILDRTPEAVRQQLSRALRFLEKRLAAVGRTPRGGRQRAPARLAVRPMRVLRERRFGLTSPGPV